MSCAINHRAGCEGKGGILPPSAAGGGQDAAPAPPAAPHKGARCSPELSSPLSCPHHQPQPVVAKRRTAPSCAPPCKRLGAGKSKRDWGPASPPSVSHSHAGGAIIPLQLGARLSTGKTPIPQALFRNVFPIVKNVETKSIQLCGFIFFSPPFMKLFVAVL